MTSIVSDSSALLNQKEAKEAGFYEAALDVNLSDGTTYKDLDGIDGKTLIEKIQEGLVPSTSQPSIGQKVEYYNELTKKGNVIDICIADGLSGCYQSALSAKSMCDDPDKVYIFNSQTLCAPQRDMVLKAVEMAKENKSTQEILKCLEQAKNTDISFLIPFDFSFLKRGGRVSGMEAELGSLLKLIPVMKKAEDGRSLEKFCVSRTLTKAISAIKEYLQDKISPDYKIYISHAFNEKKALKIKEDLQKAFSSNSIEILPLSPAFIAQGGPGCIAVQTIKTD